MFFRNFNAYERNADLEPVFEVDIFGAGEDIVLQFHPFIREGTEFEPGGESYPGGQRRSGTAFKIKTYLIRKSVNLVFKREDELRIAGNDG